MNIKANVISIPNAISADEAKEWIKKHDEAEMQVDIRKFFDYICTELWVETRQKANEGKVPYPFTIGFNSGNALRVRKRYSWIWLQEKGTQFITDLFTSAGYKVQIRRYARFLRFDITWAD